MDASMPSKRSGDNNAAPSWLQSLKPSQYAKSWFDETGFAQKAEAAIASTRLKKGEEKEEEWGEEEWGPQEATSSYPTTATAAAYDAGDAAPDDDQWQLGHPKW